MVKNSRKNIDGFFLIFMCNIINLSISKHGFIKMIQKEVHLEEEDLKICFLKVFFVKLLPEKVCTSSISIFHQVIEALSLESSLFLISLY